MLYHLKKAAAVLLAVILLSSECAAEKGKAHLAIGSFTDLDGYPGGAKGQGVSILKFSVQSSGGKSFEGSLDVDRVIPVSKTGKNPSYCEKLPSGRLACCNAATGESSGVTTIQLSDSGSDTSFSSASGGPQPVSLAVVDDTRVAVADYTGSLSVVDPSHHLSSRRLLSQGGAGFRFSRMKPSNTSVLGPASTPPGGATLGAPPPPPPPPPPADPAASGRTVFKDLVSDLGKDKDNSTGGSLSPPPPTPATGAPAPSNAPAPPPKSQQHPPTVKDVYVPPKGDVQAKAYPQDSPRFYDALEVADGILLVPDFGSDYLRMFKVATSGKIIEGPKLKTRSGCGPFKATMRETGDVYVICMLTAEIMHVSRGCVGGQMDDGTSTGGMGICEMTKVLPESEQKASDAATAVRLSPDEEFVYVTVHHEGREGVVVGFELSTEGRVMERVGTWPTEGLTPWDFQIVQIPEVEEKDFLVIANRDSNTVVAITRLVGSGKLHNKPIAVRELGTPASVIVL